MTNRSCVLLLLSFLFFDFTNAFTSPAATRTCRLNAATTSRSSSSTIRTFYQPQQLKSNGLSLQMQPRTAGSVEENEESKVCMYVCTIFVYFVVVIVVVTQSALY